MICSIYDNESNYSRLPRWPSAGSDYSASTAELPTFIYTYLYLSLSLSLYIYIYIYMRNVLGWLETRLAQNALNYLKLA